MDTTASPACCSALAFFFPDWHSEQGPIIIINADVAPNSVTIQKIDGYVCRTLQSYDQLDCPAF
jgi:hypothetical protein